MLECQVELDSEWVVWSICCIISVGTGDFNAILSLTQTSTNIERSSASKAKVICDEIYIIKVATVSRVSCVVSASVEIGVLLAYVGVFSLRNFNVNCLALINATVRQLIRQIRVKSNDAVGIEHPSIEVGRCWISHVILNIVRLVQAFTVVIHISKVFLL